MLVSLTPLLTFGLFTDAAGLASLCLPIPIDSALNQIDLFTQWAIVDSQAKASLPIALTPGLRLHMGPQN